jgi:predicted patatin/cPLA2 family phospholipase
MTRREFIDLRRALGRKDILDLNWLWDELARTEPLDVDAILQTGKQFVAVATSVQTGDPVYLRPDRATFFDVLRASCALPWLVRQPVHVEGRDLVDGGLSDPFAVQEAYRRGARKIVVVRSRPAAFTKQPSLGSRWLALTAKSAGLANAYRKSAPRYGAAVDFALSPPADCQIVHVAPVEALPVKRMTQDVRALDLSYAIGRERGLLAISQWQALA